MVRNTKNKPPKRGPRKEVPTQTKGGGPVGGDIEYTVSSDGRLASFFTSQFFLTFAVLFIGIMIAMVWLIYRPRLVTVVLAIVLLALALGGAFWLGTRARKRSDELGGDAQFLNETHDRRDYTDRSWEERDDLITQPPPLPAGVSSDNPQKLRNIEDGFRALLQKVNEIDGRLAQLERELYYPTSPKPMSESRSRAEVLAPPPSKRQASAYESYQESRSYSSSIDLSTLSQAVSRFLAEQSGGWEIEWLVQSVRRSADGNVPIEVEHLGSHSSGEWRLVALWPQRSQEGLVVVSSGELVDDDIAKYFDVGFGRRIIACKQPARVSRSGSEVTVLSRGRVESS